MFAVSNKARQSFFGSPAKTAPEESAARKNKSKIAGKRTGIMPIMDDDAVSGSHEKDIEKGKNASVISKTKLFDETMTYPHEFNIAQRIAAEDAIFKNDGGSKMSVQNAIDRGKMKQSYRLRNESTMHNLGLLSEAASSYPIDSRYKAEFLEMVKDLDTELLTYRKTLKEEHDILTFNLQWGLLPPQFDKSALALKERDANCIVAKIANALLKSKLFLESISNKPDHQAGAELVRLYVEDSLGPESTHAGTFTSKHKAEFARKQASSISLKFLLLCFVVTIDIFLILVCMSYGNERGSKWQRSWLLTVLFKILIDLVFSQFFNGLIIGFLLPNLLINDLAMVRSKLLRSGEKLLTSESPYKFNRFSTTDFTFASSLVAKQMPDLIESRLILMHRDHVPERIFQRRHKYWKRIHAAAALPTGTLSSTAPVTGKSKEFKENKMRIWYQSFSFSLIQFALAFGSLSQDIQSVIIYVIPSTVSLGLSWFFILIYNNHALFLSLLLILLSFVVTFLYFGIKKAFNYFCGFSNSNRLRSIQQGKDNGPTNKSELAKQRMSRLNPFTGLVERLAWANVMADVSDSEISASDEEELSISSTSSPVVHSTAVPPMSHIGTQPPPLGAPVVTRDGQDIGSFDSHASLTPVASAIIDDYVSDSVSLGSQCAKVQDKEVKVDINLEVRSKVIQIAGEAAATRHRGSILRREGIKRDRLLERLQEKKLGAKASGEKVNSSVKQTILSLDLLDINGDSLGDSEPEKEIKKSAKKKKKKKKKEKLSRKSSSKMKSKSIIASRDLPLLPCDDDTDDGCGDGDGHDIEEHACSEVGFGGDEVRVGEQTAVLAYEETEKAVKASSKTSVGGTCNQNESKTAAKDTDVALASSGNDIDIVVESDNDNDDECWVTDGEYNDGAFETDIRVEKKKKKKNIKNYRSKNSKKLKDVNKGDDTA
jgi:hypothetical protein